MTEYPNINPYCGSLWLLDIGYSLLSPPRKPSFKPSRKRCKGIADDKVDNGYKEEDLRGIYDRTVVDLCGHVGQLRDADDECQ